MRWKIMRRSTVSKRSGWAVALEDRLRTSEGARILHTERVSTGARTSGPSADLQVEQLAEALLP